MATEYLLQRGSHRAQRGNGDTTDGPPPGDRSSGAGAPERAWPKLPPAADARLQEGRGRPGEHGRGVRLRESLFVHAHLPQGKER